MKLLLGLGLTLLSFFEGERKLNEFHDDEDSSCWTMVTNEKFSVGIDLKKKAFLLEINFKKINK